MSHIEGDMRSPQGARYAIIASRWNPRITDTLVAGARKTFIDNGVSEDAVDVIRVPGAWEIAVTADRLGAAGGHAAIVALGCVVRGDTRHYEQVADGCSDALMRVSLDYGVPVANGVLAVDRFEDAEARAGGNHGNKGEEAALVAIEMAHLFSQLPEGFDVPVDVVLEKAS
jgi:6,7-dimethyl-8-ribityllumazine synthase